MNCSLVFFSLIVAAVPSVLQAALPREAVPLPVLERPASWTERDGVISAGEGDWLVRQELTNTRIHVEYFRPSDDAVASLELRDGGAAALDGPAGTWQTLEMAVEQLPSKPGLARVWREGQETSRMEIAVPAEAGSSPAASFQSTLQQARTELRWDQDFTLTIRFRTTTGGTLASMTPLDGPWAPNAKAFFIRDGRLVYDIGWVGAHVDGPVVADGQWHTAALVSRQGTVSLHLDGRPLSSHADFSRPDAATHVFKIGSASPDFGGAFAGDLAAVRFYRRALSGEEIDQLTGPDARQANTPDFEWQPTDRPGATAPTLRLTATAGMQFRQVWSQPLDRTDHRAIISLWNDDSLDRGRQIYAQLCVVCHGTLEAPGSLPTAPRFAEGLMKNGSDPYAMFNTLTRGYGQMVAQPQYTARQKYDVIHYIRETFLRKNPSQYAETNAEYLHGLPRGLATADEEQEVERKPPYQMMDFGPSLLWTYEVAPDNLAHKGIAIRLDEGPGGISQGRNWMLYDHDTMRVASAWSGEGFVDWKGIAFDGSHGSHTSIVGDQTVTNPVGPGWADPASGSWDDPRPLGRDGKPFGPLPRAWTHYQGIYQHGTRVVVSYTVGTTAVLDSPGLIAYGASPVFVRTLNVGPSTAPLTMRIAPDQESVAISLHGEGASLQKNEGFTCLQLPPSTLPRQLRIFMTRLDAATLRALQETDTTPLDLAPLTRGGPPRWNQEVTTTVAVGAEDGAVAVDTLTLPSTNPWQAWMRTSGFDFYPDGKSAAVCTWNGDVWRVDGVDGTGDLRWHRLATGLFQPLGVKFRNGELFVCCRDQIARLRDVNGDGETDFIENFNNDHQVTAHFHEFAMGLQVDAAGNFYYAKSARHALPAVVPHHGTLLRVSADGATTEIIAHGFRAANGVCLNPDGTFFVTDQEGHWTPKNRINHVLPDGGFYGNMFGYTSVTDTADTAMRQPLAWITNDKDRSPAELVWVPPSTWGPLAGSLLNLSYGYGRVYIVPHEHVGNQVQGGVCELPIADLPTGVMRGRFHPNGALYACGMVGWATNCQQDGGFYRLRHTGRPFHLPTQVVARPGQISLTFTEPLDPATPASAIAVKTWSLRRSADYGSQHINEHPLTVTKIQFSPDQRTITLHLPDLAPAHSVAITWNMRDAAGTAFTGSLHHTIHTLTPPATAKIP